MNAPPLKHLYLIDGSGYIFRAFFALPPMTRADGTPVNAVFGFNDLVACTGQGKIDHLANASRVIDGNNDLAYNCISSPKSQQNLRLTAYSHDSPHNLLP